MEAEMGKITVLVQGRGVVHKNNINRKQLGHGSMFLSYQLWQET
jgi:hypothetical protein